MDYFVCIENTAYFHWQLQLLLKSFQQHNLEDKLFIAVCGGESLPEFLKSHSRVMLQPDIGLQRGYNRLNYLYSLNSAISDKKISQPFTLIEPDMVLCLPIPEKCVYNVSFQIDSKMTLESAENNTCHLTEFLKKKDWLPVGSTIVFYRVPDFIFHRAIAMTEQIAIKQLEQDKPIWKFTDKLGWIFTFLESLPVLKYEALFGYEMNMMENKETRNFIHYKHGLPPVFSKKLFKNDYLTLSGDTPFEILSRHAPTSAAHYMQKLAIELLNNV